MVVFGLVHTDKINCCNNKYSINIFRHIDISCTYESINGEYKISDETLICYSFTSGRYSNYDVKIYN